MFLYVTQAEMICQAYFQYKVVTVRVEPASFLISTVKILPSIVPVSLLKTFPFVLVVIKDLTFEPFLLNKSL